MHNILIKFWKLFVARALIVLLHVIIFSTLLYAKHLDSYSSQVLFEQESSRIIKELLKTQNIPPLVLNHSHVKRYYKGHQYRPFWFDVNGTKAITIELINTVENDPVLKPISNKLFGLHEIMMLMSEIESSEVLDIHKVMRVDFMITGIYDYYMKLLASGSIDWKNFELKLEKLESEEKIIGTWDRYGVHKNRIKLLYKALEQDNIHSAIDSVNYTFPMAKELENVLLHYEKISQEGGYTPLPEFTKLAKGDYSSSVTLLRERLIQSGELSTTECMVLDANSSNTNCLELFDANVKGAVRLFQRNHGLVVDGVVGADTRKRLNITVEQKITQIRLNLERMRWLPRTLGNKYLLVNIPDYKLLMVDEENISLEMPVVVGKKRYPTPVFSHKMSSIVLNPYWRVPHSIVKKEMVPQLVKNSSYFDERGIRMHADWNESSPHYDFNSIDWRVYLENKNEEENFDVPMRFIQVPSNSNPLGRVKFMFPNRYSVYIHDTSEKRFFKYRQRAFSHGCIRLSKPDELLQCIAKDDENVDYNETQEILNDMDKIKIGLETSIPIHMVYLTSWVNKSGVIQFRDDIYSYDTMQYELLNRLEMRPK